MVDKYKGMLMYIRDNSRISLTKLSKKTNIPVSTLFDKLKEMEQKEIIIKHTAILNYPKLGYPIRAHLLVEDTIEKTALKFLKSTQNTNTLFSINNGFDYIADVMFHDLTELSNFIDLLKAQAKRVQEHLIIRGILQEQFLTEGYYE